MLFQATGLQGASENAWTKRKRKRKCKVFQAHGREGLPIQCYQVEEIANSEQSMEEKVEMILMQNVAIF